MSSRFLHQSSTEGADVGRAGVAGEHRSSSIEITVIVQHRYTFETELVTGRQIKETANVPGDFALYRRVQRGNEPIPDDAEVELHNGDHFFARPTSRSS